MEAQYVGSSSALVSSACQAGYKQSISGEQGAGLKVKGKRSNMEEKRVKDVVVSEEVYVCGALTYLSH